MKYFLLAAATAVVMFTTACKNQNAAGTAKPMCDTVCMKDSLIFRDDASKLKPYIEISARNCKGDTLTWGFEGQNKNIPFNYRLNRDFAKCYLKDTTYGVLLFNTCENGRGYFYKFGFGKKASFTKSSSAINAFDPRFVVADSLLAYTDSGNLFVEKIGSPGQAMMTFGQQLQFDFDAIHETLDSVNISSTRIWAKAKVNGDWKTFEKAISL